MNREARMSKLTMSYVHGASDLPLVGQTIGGVLDEAAAKNPDREAIVALHQDLRWSYTDFNRKVDDLACGFLALGLRQGDRIGIWSPNNAEWLLTMFAAAKAGLILVTLNPAYRINEAAYCLVKSGCTAL